MYTCLNTVYFNAQCYASAIYAVIMCLSVHHEYVEQRGPFGDKHQLNKLIDVTYVI